MVLSATLSSLGICFHWLGSELLCISATLDDTNGLKLLDGLCIQDKTMILSMKNVTDLNCNLLSSCMALANRLATTTAACNSNRRMVSCFSGATLDFAAMNFTAAYLAVFCLLSYISACRLRMLLGIRQQRHTVMVCRSDPLSSSRLLSNDEVLGSAISWNRETHFSFTTGGSSSSQSSPNRPIFALTTTGCTKKSIHLEN